MDARTAAVLAALFTVALLFASVPPTHAAAALNGEEKVVPAGSQTDAHAVERDNMAIKIDGMSVDEIQKLRANAEQHAYQAEVSRMMSIIINSLYKNKDIFLRELISNASDAIDKIRFLALTDKSVLGDTTDLSIKLKIDAENNVLHIIDTGIGMSKDDLIRNLGTIAKSGTSDFLAKVQEGGAMDSSTLIGQFGVGFYSAFLVANRVVVTSKHNDDEQYIWESDASNFSVSKDPRGNTLGRGTQVSLYMKEDSGEFLEQEALEKLAQKYSEFIVFPILLWKSKTEKIEEPIVETEMPKEDDGVDKKEEEDADVEDAAEEEEKTKTKTVERTVWDYERINQNKAIWTRKPSEVSEEEYVRFYRDFTKSHEDPIAYTHFDAEGEVSFRSILYIPGRAPHGFLDNFQQFQSRIRLYVRRVFISSDFESLTPKYLSFVEGVLDSDDMPLSVSRETLQQSKLLKVIRRKVIRKVLDMIKKLSEDEVKYAKFWEEYGVALKVGVIDDSSNRNRVAKLLRFQSSNAATGLISLDDYVKRMKKGQKDIFYVAGTTRADLETSPLVEKLLKKGYEVLFLTEPIDEYCMQAIPDFEGHKLVSTAKGEIGAGKSESAIERRKQLDETYKPLLDWLKEKPLKDLIESAAVSTRLTDSPCALIAGKLGVSGNMERILRAQNRAGTDMLSKFYLEQKKVLDINPRHPLIKALLARITADPDDATAADLAHVLYDGAMLRSGYQLVDNTAFASRMERMLRLSMGVSPDEPVEAEPEEPEEVEEEDNEEVAGGDDDNSGQSKADSARKTALDPDAPAEDESDDLRDEL